MDSKALALHTVEARKVMCALCKRIEAAGLLHVLTPRERAWWEKHKSYDAKKEHLLC